MVEIYIYSFQKFGEARADAYFLSLEEYFSLLAEQPGIGRNIDHVRKGYLRHEHGHHPIFYMKKRNGIPIVRILHQHMDSDSHL
ncbi:MAG: type II toxin-antitoxin system RelE/ParE family toxin [Thermodesulfobacteriota bacterium]